MSMTALVSAFARAYHTRCEGAKIFDDKYARLLLSTEEHEQIGAHMASGVSHFLHFLRAFPAAPTCFEGPALPLLLHPLCLY